MKTRIVMVGTALMLALTGCGSAPIQDSDAVQLDSIGSNEAVQENISGEDIIITMPVFKKPDEEIRKIINEFNNADNGYHLETVDYSDYYESPDGKNPDLDGYDSNGFNKLNMQLQMDILKGGILTIVSDEMFSAGRDIGKFDILMRKGAFVDLYSFMEQDKEVNTSTLNTHILNLSEIDGKLYDLPTGYVVSTLYGPSDLVGTKENWTIDEMFGHYDALNEEVAFNGVVDQWGVYRVLLRDNIGAFVDYENGTCSFDSPEFVKILEYLKNCIPNNPYKQTTRNGLAPFENFVTEVKINDFVRFHNIVFAANDPEKEYTLVGYPSADGCGASIDTQKHRYSICANATFEQQQGAWEFLRMLMQEEYQYTLGYGIIVDTSDPDNIIHEGGVFPVNTAAFEHLAEEERKNEGKPHIITAQGFEIDEGYPTKAEYDRLKSYIAGITKMNTVLDKEMDEIITDELGMMFEGVHSPQETADAIQGRMEIMVNEKI